MRTMPIKRTTNAYSAVNRAKNSFLENVNKGVYERKKAWAKWLIQELWERQEMNRE